ncbi:protein of unknown function [Ruminococcaceae bacterium BL-6]|nr:protein of unknown function [Ruminococcaceae bacterium BL-6]
MPPEKIALGRNHLRLFRKSRESARLLGKIVSVPWTYADESGKQLGVKEMKR